MPKFYNSGYYKKPIEVINNNWNISVIITDTLERKSIYSWYNINEKTSDSPYINKCLLWGFLQNKINKVLVIWSWWWAFIKYLEDHIKNIKITWIDIDEAMALIAKNELLIKTNDIIIWDFNNILKRLINENLVYDLILFDVYWWNWEIPNDILGTDFFSNINKLLKKSWIFSINYSNFNSWVCDNENQNRVKYYEEIHKKLKKELWNSFLSFLSWENCSENISWIYNLKKKYTLKEIKDIYFKKVKDNKIILDSKIIEGIYLDNNWLFLK